MLVKIVAIIILNGALLKAASSPYSFLDYNSNARSSALSGAYVSAYEDAGALFFNPASINTVENKFIQGTFLKHALDINSGNISYIYDKLSNGRIAASIAYSSYGSFDYADINGFKNGRSFSGNNIAIGVTYANELDSNLFYGVTAKFISLSLEQSNGAAVAFDAGLLYKLKDKRTNFGVAVTNSGFEISNIENGSNKLPMDLRIGVSHRLKGLPLLVNMNFHHLANSSESVGNRFKNFSLGGELYIGKYLQARIGYNNQIRNYLSSESSKGLSGLSFGAGILLKDINIDYAFAQYGSAATLHRMSITMDL